MVLQKRWFIKDGTDIKEFGRALKACKEFTPEYQKNMVKIIMDMKLDRLVITGVKKRRIRKKLLKKEVEGMKKDCTWRLLDMMVEEWRDVPENTTREDGINALNAIIGLTEAEDKRK